MIRKLFALSLLAVALAGCGERGERSAIGASPAHSATVASLNEFEPTTVVVSRSKNFGQINAAPLGTFTDAPSVKAFAKAIRSADKIEGMLDIRKPDFDVVLSAADNESAGYHLWIDPGTGGGMVTTVEDSGTGYRLSQQSADKLRELIYRLYYGSDQAENNGDIVFAMRGVSNEKRWTKFVRNVEGGTPDDVQVTMYTIEGAPIFYDLQYDGRAIAYTFDNTFDGYGTPQKKLTFCTGVGRSKDGIYVLSGCDNEEAANTFGLRLP